MASNRHIRPAWTRGHPLLTPSWRNLISHGEDCESCSKAYRLHDLEQLCKRGQRLRQLAKDST